MKTQAETTEILTLLLHNNHPPFPPIPIHTDTNLTTDRLITVTAVAILELILEISHEDALKLLPKPT